MKRVLAALVVLTLMATCLAAPAFAEDEGGYDTVDFYTTIAAFTDATGETIDSFQESPALTALVEAGELAPVAERISAEPMVVVPLDSVGTYGGRIRSAATSPTTGSAETWTARTQPLLIVGSELSSVQPNIAKGWAFNDDYTELTLYLREGMFWSDGEPFDADDFAFYWDYMAHNEELFPNKIGLWNMNGKPVAFEKVGQYEVKYIFPEPYPTIINAFAVNNRNYHTIPFAPEHYLSQFHIDLNPEAEALAKEAGYDTWYSHFLFVYPDEVQQRLNPELPCVDPWMLVSVDEIGNKYFDRNPYYWKVDTAGNQLPYIDGQDRMLLDGAAITMELLAGKLDYCLQFAKVDDYALYVEYAEQADIRTALWVDARGSVGANMKANQHYTGDPLVADLLTNTTFLEALSLALNREEINDIIWLGLATPRAATVSDTVAYYEDWMGEYMAAYDVEGANARLDELGFDWDSNHTYRLHPTGETLELTLEFTTLANNTTAIMELVKQYWEAIGVKTNLKQHDQSLFEVRSNAGELQFRIWNLDNTTALGHQGGPLILAPYAQTFDIWRTSNGENGDVPPENVQAYYHLSKDFQQVEMGSERYMEIGKELLTVALENMWNIGIAGMTPQPMVVKNNLLNTPENGIFDYDFRFWMVFHPEQWYWGE